MKQQLSITTREHELTQLIQDAEVLGFSPELMDTYKKQLSEVRTELHEIRAIKSKARRISQELINTPHLFKPQQPQGINSPVLNVELLQDDSKIFVICSKCNRPYRDFPNLNKKVQVCPVCVLESQEVLK